MYDVFGLQYRMALSTRPEKYMGSPELWAKAEASLEDALNASGQQWEVPVLDDVYLREWSAGMLCRSIRAPQHCLCKCQTSPARPRRRRRLPAAILD